MSKQQYNIYIVSKILQNLSAPFEYCDQVIHSGASIGVVMYPDNADNSHQLIQQADTAMYEAKKSGRNTYRFFTWEMSENISRRNKLLTALRKAIEANELALEYQPLIETRTGQTVAAEALLRWCSHEPDRVVSTSEFISIAEEHGLIDRVGEWVLEHACLQYKQWQQQGLSELEHIAVNVSIHQLVSVEFADIARNICLKTGVEPQQVELEITEGGLAQFPDHIMDVLHQLRVYGFKLAIDDFGTDYSSLARLKAFNVDSLKIDRSFVAEMTQNEDVASIVRAIIDLGSALGLSILAEGVETQEQYELLKSYGCKRCQGYYFGRPVIAEQFVRQYLH